MNYSFSIFNGFAKVGLSMALSQVLDCQSPPVFLCIGSDMAIGDSLGPLVGTLLKTKKVKAYIYGTLKKPVTAKEIRFTNSYLSILHPNSKVIAIDAAIGNTDDVGLIKVYKQGIKPGLGAQKDLQKVGDISILGIVAVKSFMNYTLLNSTRLNMIYQMAEIIADSIHLYLQTSEQTPSNKHMFNCL